MRAKTALIVIGIPRATVEMSCLPSSMRFAISISPSRLSSETLPISFRYSRTGSSVRARSPGVRSIFFSSSSVSPTSSASSVVLSPSDIICWYRSPSGESMISMSFLPNLVVRLRAERQRARDAPALGIILKIDDGLVHRRLAALVPPLQDQRDQPPRPGIRKVFCRQLRQHRRRQLVVEEQPHEHLLILGKRHALDRTHRSVTRRVVDN